MVEINKALYCTIDPLWLNKCIHRKTTNLIPCTDYILSQSLGKMIKAMAVEDKIRAGRGGLGSALLTDLFSFSAVT